MVAGLLRPPLAVCSRGIQRGAIGERAALEDKVPASGGVERRQGVAQPERATIDLERARALEGLNRVRRHARDVLDGAMSEQGALSLLVEKVSEASSEELDGLEALIRQRRKELKS